VNLLTRKSELVAVGAFAAEQAEELVEKAEMVYGYGQLDVTAVTGTAEQCCQSAC